jgi:hypothetical protein
VHDKDSTLSRSYADFAALQTNLGPSQPFIHSEVHTTSIIRAINALILEAVCTSEKPNLKHDYVVLYLRRL